MDITEEKSKIEIFCYLCDQEFTHKKNLYAHLRNIHEIEPLLKPEQREECPICHAKFTTKSTMSRHKKYFHPQPDIDHDYNQAANRKTRLRCPYETCTEALPTYLKLRGHLQEAHQFAVEYEEFQFESQKDFEIWKYNMEQNTLSKYVSDTAMKKLRNGNSKAYHNCHRSYHFQSKGKNKRALKAGGSNKINRACPARLEVRISTTEHVQIAVKFWKTHCGHDGDVRRITLDKNTRAKIAGVIQGGVPLNNILEAVRDQRVALGEKNSRLGILDRKDIHNIIRDFKIDYEAKTPDQTEDNIKDNKWVNYISDPKEEAPELFYVDNDVEYTDIEHLEEEEETPANGLELRKRLLEKIETVTTLTQTIDFSENTANVIEKQLDKIIDLFLNAEEPV